MCAVGGIEKREKSECKMFFQPMPGFVKIIQMIFNAHPLCIGSHVLLETQPAEKLNALLEITGFLSKTLEIEPLLARIVDSLFQLFKQADRVFLILRDESSGLIYPKIIKTRRPDDETTARFSRRIVNMCLENVQALLSDDASGDSRFALSQSIADFRIRSVMCAPLW